MNKTLLIFGTRPELIKLAPVIYEFKKRGLRNNLVVINTNQHNSLLSKVVVDFKIEIDHTLDIDNKSNSLSILSAEITRNLEILVQEIKQKDTIGSVIVQGDTTSTYCGSLVAFYNQIPVHYIEAGLRTYDYSKPFPEEFHRRVVSLTSSFLYAPTASASQNLLREGFNESRILVTGNTIIDSIILMKELTATDDTNLERRTILCTIHRRENHGSNVKAYIESIINLANNYSEYQFVIIRHPNPHITDVLEDYSSKMKSNLVISDPVSYSRMLKLIESSKLIITDSGGLQEEASYFQVPVIVLRQSTERVEGIQNKHAICINNTNNNIDELFTNMLTLDTEDSDKFLYGDGSASKKIVDNILHV